MADGQRAEGLGPRRCRLNPLGTQLSRRGWATVAGPGRAGWGIAVGIGRQAAGGLTRERRRGARAKTKQSGPAERTAAVRPGRGPSRSGGCGAASGPGLAGGCGEPAAVPALAWFLGGTETLPPRGLRLSSPWPGAACVSSERPAECEETRGSALPRSPLPQLRSDSPAADTFDPESSWGPLWDESKTGP